MEPTALILVGGLGTRLRPLTETLPKPMVPVGDRPFLAWQLEHLARSGIRRFVLAVGYRAQAIRDYFGDGRAFGWEIAYSVEEEPLGTGGAIRQALPLLPQRFLAFNGDSFLFGDLSAFAAAPWANAPAGAPGVLGIVEVPDIAACGAVEWEGRRLLRFREKEGVHTPGWINAGIYAFEQSFFSGAPRAFSVERDLLTPQATSLGVWPLVGDFIDIGTFSTLDAFRSRVEAATRRLG